MKILRRLTVVALFLGSYQLGIAQSNSVPTFNSEAEKAAWVKEHPEALPKQEIKRQDPNVRSEQRFASDAEKQTWIEANPEEYREMIGEKGHMSTTGAVRGWVKDNTGASKTTPQENKNSKTNKREYKVDRSNERFASDAEKQAWIEANQNEYYESIGKSKQFHSIEEKQAWIKANPAQYEAMKNAGEPVKVEQKKFVPQEIFESEEEKEYLKKNNPEEFQRRISTKTNQ